MGICKKRVTKELKEANGNLDQLSPVVIKQIATAYISNSEGLKRLYTFEDVAKYYGTSVHIVRKIIAKGVKEFIIPFNTAVRINKRATSNESRHFDESGISPNSMSRNSMLFKRSECLITNFDELADRLDYQVIYKSFIEGQSKAVIASTWGISQAELFYILVRSACVYMSKIEYKKFQERFLEEFMEQTGFWSIITLMEDFHKDYDYLYLDVEFLEIYFVKECEERNLTFF